MIKVDTEELDLIGSRNEPVYEHDNVRSGYHCDELRFVKCDCHEEH